MPCTLTLDYWIDDGWYVGKLREVPGVFSQGESLAELKVNIQDAYRLMTEDASVPVAKELRPKWELRRLSPLKVSLDKVGSTQTK